MAKMKRCVVVTSFAEDQPGFLDFSYRVHSLAKCYDLTIISQQKLDQPEMNIDGVNYTVFHSVYNKVTWLMYLFKAAKFIRALNPDLVVLLHSNLSPISLLIGKIPNCVYWNEHPTNLMHLPKKSSFLKYVITKFFHHVFFLGARCSNLIMPIGEEHRDELLKKGSNKSKVNMIYMGVSSKFLSISHRKHKNLNDFVIIYTGSVSKPRGRDVLLEAMKIVARKHLPVRLVMVGANSEELQYCQKFIEDNSLKNHVDVIGRVPGDDIPILLSNADMGICLWEDRVCWRFNPPTKLFEYLVAGLPVLASNIRTHTRYINNGINGFIFDYTAESLASVINDCYANRDQLDLWKKQARLTSTSYLWEKIEPIFLSNIKRIEKNEIAN